MIDIRSEIAATLIMPDFLKDIESDREDDTIGAYIISIIYKILDFHYRGVTDEFLSDLQIKRICRRIDSLSRELSSFAPAELNLNSWLWIGDTVTKWIEISVGAEKYEAATNLRKILNSEYA